MKTESRRARSIGERGQALALAAVVFALVVPPLLALVVETGRWHYVREALQGAADAAAAAAASQAVDTARFVDTGEVAFDDDLAAGLAQAVFAQAVADAGLAGHAPALTGFAVDQASVTVTAQAAVRPSLPLAPAVTIHVAAVSQARAAQP